MWGGWTGPAGRIWTTQPSAEADGLLTVVQMAQSRPHGGHFTAVAFAPTAQCLAMVDSRGNVFAFHIKKCVSSLLPLAHLLPYSSLICDALRQRAATLRPSRWSRALPLCEGKWEARRRAHRSGPTCLRIPSMRRAQCAALFAALDGLCRRAWGYAAGYSERTALAAAGCVGI